MAHLPPLKLPTLTRHELMSALKRTYPNAIVRKVQEFTTKNVGKSWIWFGGEHDEILLSSYYSEKFESRISNKFSKWLNAVGWYYEHYDFGVYFLIPLSDITQPTAEQTQQNKLAERRERHLQSEIKAGRIVQLPANYCPF